jgi:hypothetical protein
VDLWTAGPTAFDIFAAREAGFDAVDGARSGIEVP